MTHGLAWKTCNLMAIQHHARHSMVDNSMRYIFWPTPMRWKHLLNLKNKYLKDSLFLHGLFGFKGILTIVGSFGALLKYKCFKRKSHIILLLSTKKKQRRNKKIKKRLRDLLALIYLLDKK